LAFAASEFPEGSEVVLPSFTFAATVQAVLWNRLTPVYVDCLPGTMVMDPEEVRRAIEPTVAAICPVTVFGLPPDYDELNSLSREYGIPLVCDSAQALGSTYQGSPAGGLGACEVFSLSPTKVITAIEGGIVTTNDAEFAQRLRCMRDYGKGPDGEEMVLNGLSARMSEFHAGVGLLSLRKADTLVRSRHELIHAYRERAKALPGCGVQEFPEDRTTSGNYFTLLIGSDAKMDRDRVFNALKNEHIQTKRYFYPPVHAQRAFRDKPHRVVGDLKNTWSASLTSLALPLYSHMTTEQQNRICDALDSLLK
jgi:dTDP-4-amino-4,6-dideoxygalactose transaminase